VRQLALPSLRSRSTPASAPRGRTGGPETARRSSFSMTSVSWAPYAKTLSSRDVYALDIHGALLGEGVPSQDSSLRPGRLGDRVSLDWTLTRCAPTPSVPANGVRPRRRRRAEEPRLGRVPGGRRGSAVSASSARPVTWSKVPTEHQAPEPCTRPGPRTTTKAGIPPVRLGRSRVHPAERSRRCGASRFTSRVQAPTQTSTSFSSSIGGSGGMSVKPAVVSTV